MKINVKRISVEGEAFQGTEPASIMDLDEPDVHFEHGVAYKLEAQIQGSALLVTGRLEIPATLRCSRCLKSFELPLRVHEFVFHQELHGEDFVDLTPGIREDIILELPQRPLCAEDCKGLCPRCGKDLNEGACQCEPSGWRPHWNVLDNVKLK